MVRGLTTSFLLLCALSLPAQILSGIMAVQPAAGTPQVATPTFSPGAGTYSSTQSVTISTVTALAVLCYTTDGTTPTESGHLCSGGTTQTYTTPVSVASSLTLKAIGTLATYTDSFVGSAAYTISAGFTVLGCASAMKSATGTTLTVSYSPTSGNALIVATSPTYEGGGTSTIKLSNGTAFTQDALINSPGGTGSNQLYIGHSLSVPSGITGVTLTQGSANKSSMVVCEVSGLTTGLDKADTVGGFSTTTSWTSGTTSTTSNANDIVFGFASDVSANSATHPTMTGYTIPSNAFVGAQYNQWGVMGYLVVSSTGTQVAAGTLASSGQTAGIVAAYY